MNIFSKKMFLLGTLCCLSCACTTQPFEPLIVDTSDPSSSTKTLAQRAQEIARDSLIVDTHIDVPYRIFRNPSDVGSATADGEFDYPRARAGGLNAPFMSIYIPALVDEAGGAFGFANQTIDRMEQVIGTHPDKFALATCTQDIYQQFEDGLISMPLGMENGGPISSDFNNLEHFYKRGIRYITLTHSKSNHISDSSYDPNEHWGGLSEFGKTLVTQMNRLGVMIDVSHISDAAFWQVLERSKVPVIASHSSMRHFTPGFQRNMNDEMLRAMADRGGVIQINYGSSFLTKAARDYSMERTTALRAYQKAHHIADNDPALRVYMDSYTKGHPYPFATLEDVLDHIDRAVDVAGIDAVGIGSDYDGVGDTLPVGLKDVSTFPALIEGLLRRGYAESAIKKILAGNLMRVWDEVEAYATAQGTPLICQS